ARGAAPSRPGGCVIRTNLSTRPFYNERIVRLALAGLAILVVAATVFNVTRVIQLSRSDTRLATQASRDEARAAELHDAALKLRKTVDPKQIEVASDQARKANDLIDRRTFSWTELFNRFETTLPDDVRITSVRPKVDTKNGTLLAITVIAKGVEDVNQFVESLEGSGAFLRPLHKDTRFNDQGQAESVVEATYVATGAPRDDKVEK